MSSRAGVKMFEIIWPEHRWIPEEQIRIWYYDAVANGEATVALDSKDSEGMALALHNIGHITLGKGRFRPGHRRAA